MPTAIDTDGSDALPSSTTAHRRASLKVLTRNIDKVVLGDHEFATWYYSPYPDSIILGEDGSHRGAVNGSNGHHLPVTSLNALRPLCACLYVCPYCFRYTPRPEAYVGHLQHHFAKELEDGEHKPVPESAVAVYEWEGYAVWEVDGEVEKLYCQNLSLFGKLFLEQKSVFFDTTGFKYYVLTYTPPKESDRQHARGRRKRNSSNAGFQFDTKAQVFGFFSKEDLSWDSNNLACILVFPPFQHRQLGQLLMAISYKLSAWEWEGGVIGGPEKPLSEMGRKSYLRFWSGRIARFFMGQTADAEGRTVLDNVRKKKVNFSREEMTVKEIGERTGMLAEDVVAALNEMDVCEVVVPKRKIKRKSADSNGNSRAPSVEYEEEQVLSKAIHRSKVLAWARRNNVDLVSPVREEGFLGEWALSESNGSDDQDDQGQASTEEE